uniref:MICOS complex subunit MIC27 isoform X1 n=1 Tax=Gasterosteus aculeatus aculeatus TaxID=481459 RepID=UPI001A97EA34|nr:MICOS complex subunit MIC27 isoform X1 [Gasterosteus aculeatus aculeatus]
MAAKVVMLAVPAVMGVASIRVYTVREVTSNGLVAREKLNIYSPLPQSDPAWFVPERPGVIQRGLTTTRERLLPFVLAVKGACVAVKTRSLNMYYAGEDVYYYLKDPPPGFLPRFGTVTMSGLLGMFLTRKGSHFKRLAVPLGLMSAGASVCFPSTTVAVLKVTGKQVYAAGQWSSAAVSSLLTSKSQEPDISGTAASQPQMAAVFDEASEPSAASGSSAPSAADPETEGESAASVPVSVESAVAVTTEESVQLLVSDPDLTPAETNTDPVPAETTSEEICASVKSQEPSDMQQAAQDSMDTSPARPTASFEPETLKASPVEAAPAVDPIQVDFVPVEAALVEEAPEVGSSPSTEELPAPKALNEPPVAMLELAESEPSVKPDFTDPQQVAAVEETLPPPQQPAPENAKGGAGFTADPALMDFGQSTPEDEDLYSTRS